MSVGGIGSSSGLVQKVDQRLGKLIAKVDRAKAILAEYPTPGQVRKAERVMRDLADGVFDHPRISDSELLAKAASSPDMTFGQAIKQQNHPETQTGGETPPATGTDPGGTIDLAA